MFRISLVNPKPPNNLKKDQCSSELWGIYRGDVYNVRSRCKINVRNIGVT